MSSKEDAFNSLMEQITSFIDKFRYIDKSTEALCKKLAKTSVSSSEFTEMMKLYNSTSQMFIKSLELLDSIICRFPVEVTPDEIELLDFYRKLPESEKYIYKTRLKNGV